MCEFTEAQLNEVIKDDDAREMIGKFNVNSLLLTHWGHISFASHWEVCDVPKAGTRRQFIECAAQAINAYRMTHMELQPHHGDAKQFLSWCFRNRCIDATLPIKKWV
jgi:hypothetical protein